MQAQGRPMKLQAGSRSPIVAARTSRTPGWVAGPKGDCAGSENLQQLRLLRSLTVAAHSGGGESRTGIGFDAFATASLGWLELTAIAR